MATMLVAVSLTGCSDDEIAALLPGITTGSLPPSTSGAQLGIAIQNECDWGQPCDGDLGNAGIPASKGFDSLDDDDAEALFGLLFFTLNDDEMDVLDQDDIFESDAYWQKVATLSEDTVLTFNAVRRTNCNSTDTFGADLGDGTGGTITETFVLTSTFNADTGDSPWGQVQSDVTTNLTVAFHNCVLEGDLLDVGVVGISGTTQILLNGGYNASYHEPMTPDTDDPETARVIGRINIATNDAAVDDTFGNEFWTHVVNINAEEFWDGSDNTNNGGACAGEAIEFGTGEGAGASEADDGCADDTDEVNDAWLPASEFVDDFENDFD